MTPVTIAQAYYNRQLAATQLLMQAKLDQARKAKMGAARATSCSFIDVVIEAKELYRPLNPATKKLQTIGFAVGKAALATKRKRERSPENRRAPARRCPPD